MIFLFKSLLLNRIFFLLLLFLKLIYGEENSTAVTELAASENDVDVIGIGNDHVNSTDVDGNVVGILLYDEQQIENTTVTNGSDDNDNVPMTEFQQLEPIAIKNDSNLITISGNGTNSSSELEENRRAKRWFTLDCAHGLCHMRGSGSLNPFGNGQLSRRPPPPPPRPVWHPPPPPPRPVWRPPPPPPRPVWRPPPPPPRPVWRPPPPPPRPVWRPPPPPPRPVWHPPPPPPRPVWRPPPPPPRPVWRPPPPPPRPVWRPPPPPPRPVWRPPPPPPRPRLALKSSPFSSYGYGSRHGTYGYGYGSHRYGYG